MRKEIDHFVLFMYRPAASHGFQRLYELTDLSKKMKDELHPIPIAKTEDTDLMDKYSNDSIVRYVYFRHGEAITYNQTRYKERSIC